MGNFYDKLAFWRNEMQYLCKSMITASFWREQELHFSMQRREKWNV